MSYNLSLIVNTLATSPSEDDDIIVNHNHVPMSPSSTIPPNSPGTPGTPTTVGPVSVTGPKINLVTVYLLPLLKKLNVIIKTIIVQVDILPTLSDLSMFT